MLAHAQLDFSITQIIVNPTGKLLAVVGENVLAMLILPRRGYLKQVGRVYAVKAMRIGSYYHAPHGTAQLAQCAWHPFGRDGASLVALTEDGLVREYDVLRDIDEPQQTTVGLPDASTSRSATAFSAEDHDAGLAVAFSLLDGGSAEADTPLALQSAWLPFSLVVLTRSGDVWALCPFLPKHATVPTAALVALAEQQVGTADPLAQRYVADLVRQKDATHAEPSLDEPMLANHGWTNVQAPASVPQRVQAQGPYLLRPAPVDRSEDDAPLASDVCLTRIPSMRPTVAPLDVLVVGMRDGSVHIGLFPDPIQPLWMGRAPSAPPVLLVYESIHLPLDTSARTYAWLQDENALALLKDPLYPDTVLVTHLYGVHRLFLRPWAGPLLEAMADGSPDALRTTLARAEPTDVACLAYTSKEGAAVHMTGAVLLHDVYLSYLFFGLTADAQVVTLELGLRLPDRPADARPSEAAPYTTLLDGGAFTPPTAFVTTRANEQGGALAMTPEGLRAFGQAAEAMRLEMREVADTANATQTRLARQVQEMQRQRAQLADVARRVETLGEHGTESRLAQRLERVEAQQRASLKRTDTLLQQLMDEHAPQLSVYERRWFDEVQRMADEFGVGAAKHPAAREHLQKVRRESHPSWSIS